MVSDPHEWKCQDRLWFWRYELHRARRWFRRNGYRLACIAVAALVVYAVSLRAAEIHAGIGTGAISSVRG
ncbi:hypothetical protein [Pseudoxanthomonas dokdonensis]|uniref:hypothetical protein n=1 Tax=Pseudoxanthomonas dokdonensis TaxID=344882 RepID=UPI00070906AE|nr:hypothetical protein [Pseudoxanthomonas dokdonensis]